ncbi:MAG TPA: hypothetical protein VD963_07470 [Phycisphaerales bacterium]|nr:hypothetical protein [Phycisphaerales bacterium]
MSQAQAHPEPLDELDQSVADLLRQVDQAAAAGAPTTDPALDRAVQSALDDAASRAEDPTILPTAPGARHEPAVPDPDPNAASADPGPAPGARADSADADPAAEPELSGLADLDAHLAAEAEQLAAMDLAARAPAAASPPGAPLPSSGAPRPPDPCPVPTPAAAPARAKPPAVASPATAKPAPAPAPGQSAPVPAPAAPAPAAPPKGPDLLTRLAARLAALPVTTRHTISWAAVVTLMNAAALWTVLLLRPPTAASALSPAAPADHAGPSGAGEHDAGPAGAETGAHDDHQMPADTHPHAPPLAGH